MVWERGRRSLQIRVLQCFERGWDQEVLKCQVTNVTRSLTWPWDSLSHQLRFNTSNNCNNSPGKKQRKHDHIWNYSCPGYVLALHSGLFWGEGRLGSTEGEGGEIGEALSDWLMNWNTPRKSSSKSGWIFGICDPALAYLFELSWASGHHQFQLVTSSAFHMQIATLFHQAKEHVALWFCFYKLSYHSTCVLEPRC